MEVELHREDLDTILVALYHYGATAKDYDHVRGVINRLKELEVSHV